MHNKSLNLGSKLDKAMSQEQFDRVVEAILDGRYSWACVLVLHFAGYNPLHYIPYRTYKRLSKDNQPKRRSDEQLAENSKASGKPAQTNLSRAVIGQSLDRIEDLCFMESANEQCKQVRGGTSFGWFFRQFCN